MKFKHTISSRATLRKMKYWEFNDIPTNIIELGRKHTYEKPLAYISPYPSRMVYVLYAIKGILHIEIRHSYDVFEEVKEEKAVK